MIGGFRYIAGGLILAALVFAGLSARPFISSAPASATPAAAASSPVVVTAPGSPPPMNAAPASTAQSLLPAITFTDRPEETPPHPGWLYVQESAVLRVEPGGRGYPAPCLTKTPLIIVKGTRLWPRKTEGDWVLVQSPGGRLGWLEVTEVGKNLPFCRHMR